MWLRQHIATSACVCLMPLPCQSTFRMTWHTMLLNRLRTTLLIVLQSPSSSSARKEDTMASGAILKAQDERKLPLMLM